MQRQDENEGGVYMQEKEHAAGRRGYRAAAVFLFFFAALITTGAVFLFRGMALGELLTFRVLYGIGGGIVSLLAAFAWLVFTVSLVPMRRNLFLYDPAGKREISPEELTWQTVRTRLDHYFRLYLRGGRSASRIPPALAPLLMPYLFLVMCESAPMQDWERLLSPSDLLALEMSRGLVHIGAEEAGQLLLALRGREERTHARERLLGEKLAVERALLAYIVSDVGKYTV